MILNTIVTMLNTVQKSFLKYIPACYISTTCMNFGILHCDECDDISKIKQVLIDDINKIDDNELFNNQVKKDCYEKISSSIKNIENFYTIKESNTQQNFKTFFCRRNNADTCDSLSYDDLKCMTLSELNKKKDLKKSDEYIDRVIYESRYYNSESNSYFDKIEPIKNNRIYKSISDAIMFNKNYDIKKLEHVPHYLALCRYKEDLNNDKYCLYGWEVNMGFNIGHENLNYSINFNKDNIEKLDFPEHDYQKRNIVRGLLTIMNETPIELINMNNYVMLGLYDQKHDSFNQANDMMNSAQKEIKQKKKKTLDENELIINVNKLLTTKEFVDEFVGHILTYSKEEKNKIIEDLTVSVNNKYMCDDNNKLNLNELYKKYDYIDFSVVIGRINYLIENRLLIDFDITVDELINKLYENTNQYGMGSLNKKTKLTDADLNDIKTSYYISYLNGVPFKMHFNTFPVIDYTNYEKYHGKNSFKKVIDKIKSSK